MNINKITAIYFSPTGGTKKYAQELTSLLSQGKHTSKIPFLELDMTDRQVRSREYHFSQNELVLVGAPVYYGRLPQLPGGLFSCIHGNRTPALSFVTYGNREFDDSLLELSDRLEQQGFHSIAAGAFVAPHTFSEKAGHGRPNEEDRRVLFHLSEGIQTLLGLKELQEISLKLPGNRPYRSFDPMPFVPTADDTCDSCQICVATCPVAAIKSEEPEKTDETLCIRCLACERTCPKHSRRIQHPMFLPMMQKLEVKLLEKDKKAQIYLPE